MLKKKQKTVKQMFLLLPPFLNMPSLGIIFFAYKTQNLNIERD